MSALLTNLVQNAQQRPEAEAFRDGEGGRLTYRQLARRVAALAHWLRRQVPAGAAVVLACPNQIEYPIAFLGILAAGCSVCPISPEAAAVEFQSIVAGVHAAGVIGPARLLRLLENSRSVTLELDALPPESDQALDPSPHGDLLMQSSGTTGLPKLLRRTGPALDAVTLAVAQAIAFTAADRVLMTVPLTHTYGLEHGLLAPLWAGSGVHLCRVLDIAAVRRELAEEGITILPGVPATFEMLSRMGEGKLSMPTLRAAYSAGGPLPQSVFDALAARFGLRVTQVYGATEFGSVTYNSPTGDFDPASVGRAMCGVDIRILHPEGPRQEGEVAIRAQSMFQAYLNAPTPLVDGYFATGDLGHLDAAGRLFITGRLKLLIDVGGLKVNPLEVEAVLSAHPAVGSCVVVPVRQSQTVNRLKAVMTPRAPQTSVPVDELRRWARLHLARHKIPRLFEVRPSLPCSNTGKILRHLVEPAGPAT